MRSLLRHSKDYYNLLVNIIENEVNSPKSNNEVLWVAMGNELEIEGVDKSTISAIMRKDIEEQLYNKQFKDFLPRKDYHWHSGYFWRVTKRNGWTRSYNTDDSPPRDSSLNTNNQEIIDIFSYIKEVCNVGIEKAKEITPFEEIFGVKETREYYKQLRTIIKNCKYAFDGKTKVPTNTEQVLHQCIAVSFGDLVDGGVMYMKARTKLLENQRNAILTTKQLSRFQNGDKISHLELFKPTSRDTAIFLDYLGIQCVCGSWRVRHKLTGEDVECYDCGLSFHKKTVGKCKHCQTPLYKEQLLHMVNNDGKCKVCNVANDLPEELIVFAKS